MKIFLSYSWSNKNEADLIDNNFSSIGISIRRDIKDIKYKDNLKDFMKSIRESDFSIVLISNDYLKSHNCLIELMELFKDSDYNTKILPIICENTSIYKIEDKISIIEFWKDKCSTTEELLQKVETTKSISLLKELKLYQDIYSQISDFIESITSRLNVKFSEGVHNNFKDLLDFIGFSDNDIIEKIIEIKSIKNIQVKEIKFEKLYKENPKNKRVIFALGYLNLIEIENDFKAKEYFKQYLELDNFCDATLNNIGIACLNLNEIKAAENYFKQGLLINPNNYQLHYNYGNLECKRNNFDLALKHYLNSAKLNSNQSEIYYNIGKIYSDYKNNFDLGIEFYKKSIEINPSENQSFNNLSSIYLRNEEYEKAKEILIKSIKHNSNDAVILYNLGTIYSIQNDYKTSKKYYRKSMRIDNNYVSPKIGLAKVLILDENNLDEAKEVLLDAYNIEPMNDNITSHLSIIYHLLNDVENAVKYEELTKNSRRNNYS